VMAAFHERGPRKSFLDPGFSGSVASAEIDLDQGSKAALVDNQAGQRGRSCIFGKCLQTEQWRSP
jgi:hypothetical protein